MGERRMIPDEAVEAAAKKLYQAGGLVVWDSEDESIRNYFRRNARSALEAAAPHLMAAAWDEGGIAAIEREHAYGREEKAKFSNPYKKDAQ